LVDDEEDDEFGMFGLRDGGFGVGFGLGLGGGRWRLCLRLREERCGVQGDYGEKDREPGQAARGKGHMMYEFAIGIFAAARRIRGGHVGLMANHASLT
jgi:hypothetical protein